MKIKDFILKIKRKWMKLRLQPIRVFCLHHVCKTYDESTMYYDDWMQIDKFKAKVLSMQQDGVEFISLKEAYNKITNDKFRNRKYAVLTFDDGYASLKEILPWLDEQKIPVTLFINGKYLDGQSYRRNLKERYLAKEDLDQLYKLYPLLTIASHGWEHTDALKMSIDEFKQSIDQNTELLFSHPHYVPYHAYTWGNHTSDTDAYLLSRGITPVYIDGMKNYKNHDVIHRELLGNM